MLRVLSRLHRAAQGEHLVFAESRTQKNKSGMKAGFSPLLALDSRLLRLTSSAALHLLCQCFNGASVRAGNGSPVV